MDINIYGIGIHSKIQEIIRLLIAFYQLFVTLQNSLMEIRMTHVASVNKQILQRIAFTCMIGQAHKTLNTNYRSVGIYRKQLPVKRMSEQIHDALLQCASAHFVKNRIIVYKREINSIIYQCKPFKLTQKATQLHRIFFKELSTCGDIEKQIFHHHVTSRSASLGLLALNLATINNKACANFRALKHGAEINLRHSSNGSQSLATKAHGVERKQIGRLLNLGCGMPLKSHSRISITHALAIVHNLNQSASGITDYNLNIRGAGIHRILHQFFHHR
ncbi:putative uncharacterized protein [Bacteroides sp. CAG:927]|nr:putative uncharacterized protein [Bacteroides sp. CAG:927]